jgi:hypothetical protein
VVLAKQDEFHGPDDSLLKLEGAHNITVTGRPGISCNTVSIEKV